jgi:hypothetical protein
MIIAQAPAFLLAAVLVQYGGTPRTVTEAPAPGTLRSGERVWVDDGTCPAGQIREITGGSNRNRQGASIPNQGRQGQCVPKG